ncbi:bifunctional 2-C-methyl-D-erythritol 4-phosphate cytidylyltransferase/2-C-methyl-D-erythritol 2,4-cyclodiphosphate synthase [Microbacterium sediminis]|uniref:Bifunctional enzyme IspD/IspF n=1 Tax=Microbacterium sediminis TaxID=904291 RepID=A0A1B9N823_9MICO|nr:bifunctional 2-C-methyl-D-erythritol 4-phosphate cytidylyltransferase/2-C-methyl-D-erythritol 2,4-cyclodiphosphate synthase [Microbacterium sediminis]OCG72749.1 2-C-methyl-D-erythritol 2,4-cyclodiphosphate synthase [Microbacterium sediminis]QBR74735.1 bifunctional 2-C-methyl-D-erythritol 4-phosphate cytidylyltransferase/2-C-methyl-D-erythritol 2,4-cyclodiphosphate synthase [Microbacterium sediminis]
MTQTQPSAPPLAPRIAAIVVAAGSGTRLGAGAPKAFVGLDAHTILRHALRGVFAGPLAQVIVVAPQDRVGEALTDAREAAGDRAPLVSVVAGGASRQESVAAGLARVLPEIEIVLVHDAARALTPPAVFERVVEAIDRTGWGAVPVLPVIDTIKRVEGERIVGVVDRSELGAAQTPQGFRRDVLEAAYAAAEREYTDDAALVADAGHPIAAVDGDPLGFKITTPADLERARTLVAGDPIAPVGPAARDAAGDARPAGPPRVGVGTDAHAFGGEGTLWLAGLEWPGEPALAGHSDGDAVAHAIVDALLSATGLGDIGSRFGTDRPELAGAHAEAFLAETARLVREAGWEIGNVSVQVQAQRPRFAARRAEAEAALSAALGGAPVSVSATTTDGLGFTGRAEGVQALAVALVVPV